MKNPHCSRNRRISFLPFGLLFSVFLLPLFPQGSGDGPAGPGRKAVREEFPVRRIVLFSSGVGYYQRTGTVDGNTEIDLKFSTADINDLLKSLVVRDLDGGMVTGVTYSSREPVTRTLGTFSIDLSGKPGIAEILDQGRGEEVELDAGRSLRGKIVGIETLQNPPQPEERGTAGGTVRLLNLLTSTGFTQVDLRDIVSLRFTDPRIQGELESALALIASSNDSDTKTVSIGLSGTGRRNISAGYIREMPVWKTSYRLVLADDRKPFLQGWALVENTTGEDWNDVQLDLVSGQPISFVMDLYQPLFNPRPTVGYALQSQVDPQLYEGDLSAAKEMMPAAPPAMAAPSPWARQGTAKSAGGGFAESADSFDLSDGAAPEVRGETVGEFYRYSVTSPVYLPRQQSAMLPILNTNVDGTRYSIYNETVLAKNPLNGMLLVNTTGGPLRGGPVTIFEDGVYAGDARIDTIEPGGKRLVSYSIDLETEVAPRSKSLPEAVTSVKISRGVVQSSRLYRQEKTWVVVNRGSARKSVLIEHPIRSDWTLTAPSAPAETTRDHYRFAVPVAAGGKEELTVVEERTVRQTVALSSLDQNTLLFYLGQSVVSRSVKTALERLTGLRADLAAAQRLRQDLETQLSDIEREQTRIRANMASLERGSALYTRYVTTLNAQEDTLATLRQNLAEARTAESRRKVAVDDFIAGVDAE